MRERQHKVASGCLDVNYFFIGFLYARSGHASPYWSAAIFVVLAILATFFAIPSLRAHQHGVDTSKS
jgi:hypothetical protein